MSYSAHQGRNGRRERKRKKRFSTDGNAAMESLQQKELGSEKDSTTQY